MCRKWDNNTAILSGDTMLTLATRLLTSGTAPEKAVRLLGIFNQAAIGVYEGQQYDMEFESRNDVSIEEYIDMIRLKTSVLLGCSARLGAEMGGADRKQGDALYGFAMNLGISFQLQDDWLDVYGDSEVFGKAIGGDILNNKKTYLLIKALELAKGSDREELLGWLEKQDAEPDRKIKAVTAIYDRLGIGKICREAIESYNAEALRHLEQSGLDSDAVAFFKDFDSMVMNRNK